MPEHLISNMSKSYNHINKRVNADAKITNFIHLYKLDLITQRIKEQRVNFCGIVCHIKQKVRVRRV